MDSRAASPLPTAAFIPPCCASGWENTPPMAASNAPCSARLAEPWGSNPMPRPPRDPRPAEQILPATTRATLDEFCDTLWLEHGLARNTLAGYRSDLAQFA